MIKMFFLLVILTLSLLLSSERLIMIIHLKLSKVPAQTLIDNEELSEKLR